MLLTPTPLMRSSNVPLIPAHRISVSSAPEFRIFLSLDKMVTMANTLKLSHKKSRHNRQR